VIIDGLFSAGIAVIRLGLSVIPTASFPITGWGSAAADVVHSIGGFSQVLPVEASLVCIAGSAVYLMGSTGYNAAMWILRKIPFAGVS
jgi:hypothetical protein